MNDHWPTWVRARAVFQILTTHKQRADWSVDDFQFVAADLLES